MGHHRQLVGSLCITQAAQFGVCGDLDGWGGGVATGRDVRERRDMCIHIADSLGCTAETKVTL